MQQMNAVDKREKEGQAAKSKWKEKAKEKM